jgi:hypothetical protein
LKQTTTIQKARAVFLILILLIGIAPKSFFHDIVAHHRDVSTCKEVHKTAVFHQQGYNCHFDDLVVTTPFLFVSTQLVFKLFHFEKKQEALYSFHLPLFSQHKENRGPPTA